MNANDRDARSEWAEEMPEFGPDTQVLEGGTSRALLAAMLSEGEEEYYARLADLTEAGGLPTIKGTIARGEEAPRIGRQHLLAATGAETVESAVRIALGEIEARDHTEPTA
ncbi:hypothetical protein [Luethyella okanaganae]|uniref:Uncharacterized protein n=1 Tax=Luethyella okanaganae TaxID=69372 RepID=A0ABW1VHV9_9MICO